jgi:DNA-binding transcriptional regulator YhcF (GntR family)
VFYQVDPHSQIPPSRQLVDAVLDAMARGDVVAGDRLPSVRRMAGEALVNPNTVGKAYRELEHLGVVVGRNGSGVFATAEGARIARSQRMRATLEAFGESARRALSAGHDEQVLRKRLEAVLAGAMAGVLGGNGKDRGDDR